MSVSIILVHGTFAPDAEWTKPGSKLRRVLSERFATSGLEVEFLLARWSGRNSASSRMEAAKNIEKCVLARLENSPHRSIVLIGHSHGGSAVVEYLSASPECQSKISAAALLSTPFLYTKIAENINDLMRAFSIAMGIFLVLLLLILMSIVSDFVMRADIPGLNFAVLVFTIFFGCINVAWVWRGWTPKRMKKLKSDIDVYLSVCGGYLRTPEIPCYYSRVTGDEADSFLVTWQFVSWLATKLGLAISWLLFYFERIFRACLINKRRCVFSSLFALSSLVWLFGYLQNLIYGLGIVSHWRYISLSPLVFDIPFLDGWEYFEIMETALKMTGYIGFIIVAISLFLLILMILSVFMRYFCCVLTGWAFGLLDWKSAFYLEHAAESTPIGSVKLHHFEWERGSMGRFSLNHSRIYERSDALESLADWLVGKLHHQKTL